ncbi:hypothetical protein [Candidatus Tisiphia endosymbiont of Beris chalybata]|uniref:hypothetical protein n=1 Tax=Candidatus Tisiphia endosymbiont of Beris chalybata TaxID=3066262 RepID=UPI00312C98C8
MPKVDKIKGDIPPRIKMSPLLTAVKRAEICIYFCQQLYPELIKSQEIIDRYKELLIREFEKVDLSEDIPELIKTNNEAITFKFYYALALKHTIIRSKAKTPEFLQNAEDIKSFHDIFLQQWYDKSSSFSFSPIAAKLARGEIIKSILIGYTLPVIEESLDSLLIGKLNCVDHPHF